MKSAVIYYSATGNTKKIAEVIAEVLGTKAKSIEEEVNLQDCDLVCVGTGVRFTRMESPMEDFLNNLEQLPGKKGAVFGTYGYVPRGFLEKMAALLEGKGIEVIGEWSCQGQFLKGLNRGRPNEKDLKDAREFAANIKETINSSS